MQTVGYITVAGAGLNDNPAHPPRPSPTAMFLLRIALRLLWSVPVLLMVALLATPGSVLAAGHGDQHRHAPAAATVGGSAGT